MTANTGRLMAAPTSVRTTETEPTDRRQRLLASSIRRCGFILLVVGAMLVGACTATSSSSDTTSSSDTSNGSDRLNLTGYRGGVRTSVGLDLPEQSRIENWRWDITEEAADQPTNAKIIFTSELLDQNCENFPAFLSCPPAEDAVVAYRVSALLDLDQRLQLSIANEAHDQIRLRYAGPGPREDTLDTNLPPLNLGTHCLLIAAFEDDHLIVTGQFPDHSNAAFFLLAAGGNREATCNAPPWTGPWWPVDSAGPIQGDCAYPFLTNEPLSYSSSVPIGARGLWAVLPRCGPDTEQSFAVFAVGGVLQGREDQLAPFRLPKFEGLGIVVPVETLNSPIRVLIVTQPGDGPTSVGHSRPILNPAGR